MTRFLGHSLVWLLCVAAYANAETGTWMAIDQPLYRLIYPADIQSEAERVAQKLDLYLDQHQQEMPLKQPLRKIPIVLYSQSHTANGNVGLLPYRSRWYNKPEPFARLEWFDALAVHEGRHIVQFNQAYDNDVGQVLSVLFGEGGTAGFALLFVPTWYLEGDAVVAETTMTDGGRGRVAAFDLWFRTSVLSDQDRSYDQAMLGTGFDDVPYLSPYVLGYFLTSYLRTEYDPLIFDQVVNQLTDLDSFNFDASIRKQTGKDLNQHYQDMIAQLKARWQQQQNQLNLSDVTPLSSFNGDHWQSLYPVFARDNEVIAVHVDVEQGSKLVSIHDGHSHEITDVPATVASAFYSGSKTQGLTSDGHKTCWVADLVHPTKPFQESGDLFCYAVDQGLQRLTSADKLTEVELHGDGFIVHRFSAQRDSELVWFDSTGHEQKSLPLPKHSIAYDIRVDQYGTVFMLSNTEADGIYKLSADGHHIVQLKTPDDETLRSPLLTEHWLLYTSDRTGIDQIMAMSLSDGSVYQISARPYGSYYLNWDASAQALVFADYTAQGQQLVGLGFEDPITPPPSWLPQNSVPRTTPVATPLIGLSSPPILAATTYSPEPYKPLQALWNPHTWGALYDGTQLSGYLYSNDVMEKLSLSLSAGYHLDANDWFGSTMANYRLDSGPFLNAMLARGITDELNSDLAMSLSVSQPVVTQRGAYTQLLLGETGVKRDLSTDPAAFIQLDYQLSKDRAFQGISTPFGFHQGLELNLTADLDVNALLISDLAVQGFSNRQALLFNHQWQWLDNGESLMEASPVLPTLTNTGLTSRTRADYRVNLGPMGWSFGSPLYWRNTELSLTGETQLADAQWQSALGVTVQPSFNVLRNSNLIVNPSLSLYYLPDTDTTTIKFGIRLADL